MYTTKQSFRARDRGAYTLYGDNEDRIGGLCALQKLLQPTMLLGEDCAFALTGSGWVNNVKLISTRG